jgi:hypothetical protein
MIEKIQSSDTDLIAEYFDANELLINVGKGKTEMTVFSTGKRLSAQPRQLRVEYRGQPINTTQSYKYLGYVLGPGLTLNENFEAAYKKAGNRVRLLSKIRNYVTPSVAAKKIYQMMIVPSIVPIITYSGMVKLFLTEMKRRKLISIENRARAIIGEEIYLPDLDKLIRKKACDVLRKCLEKDICSNFYNYFEINNHSHNTRNRNNLIKLPKVKLEFSRHAFRFAAARIYNDLPCEIRAEKDNKIFRKLPENYYQ